MLLPITQFATDTLHKDGSILFANGILTLLRSLVRVHVHQILRMHKVNLLRQERFDFWIMLTSQELGTKDSCINATDHIFQESDRTVFLLDDSLPVPLIDIEGMQVVQFLVSADGIHVCIDSIAWLDGILRQSQSFPLGERMHDLCLRLPQLLDRKGDRTFHAVQVIVDTQSLQDKERGGYTTKAKFCGKVLLKKLLDQLDTHFCLAHIKQSLISYRFN